MNLARSCRLITTGKTCKCLEIYLLGRKFIHETKKVLSSEEKTTAEGPESSDSLSIDELSEPTNCCMSGCANCVWIQYAEKLSATLEKSDVDVQKLILEKVQDPNMRAFLSMELRFRNLIKD